MLILCDQDGVLANFEQAFLTEWKKRHPTLGSVPLGEREVFYISDQYPPEHRALVDEIYAERGFFRALPPIEGSIDALEGMLAAGHEVFICTAPMTSNPHCVGEKHAWIREHYGSKWLKRTIIASDKTLVRADYLIDDRPTLRGLLTPTWVHVLFGAPYNRHAVGLRLDRWADWPRVLAPRHTASPAVAPPG